MTNSEINKKIKFANDQEWFKNISCTLTYGHPDISIKKKGFIDLYNYFKRQNNGWAKLEKTLPPEFARSKELISKIFSWLNNFINRVDSLETSHLNNEWNAHVIPNLKRINTAFHFPIDHDRTSFLLEVYRKSPNYYSSAYSFLMYPNQNISNRPNDIIGAMLAYEFMFPDMEIAKRSKYEKSKLTRLGNQFESKFTETQKDVSAFLTESKKELDGILDFIEKKARTKDFEVEKLIEQKISSHEQWVNTYKKNDEDYTKHQLQRVKELEELYQEKLKLEAPAQYWQKRAKQLKEEGVRWLWGLIIVSVIAILALGAVLYFISDGTLKDLFEKTGSAIRWSIVFVTFVSFLAYAIRVFAKLTFSAYHLFRDAEEREQLAYVYLALKKEQNIDDTERHLIMQSLFSRADSGLLKDDASPTMPGGSLVEKIMGGK